MGSINSYFIGIKHVRLARMWTEYRTDKEKEMLLTQTINGIFNNLDMCLDYSVHISVIRYFCSQVFLEFKAKIKSAKEAKNTDAKKAAAREALRYWDWGVVLRLSRLPHYVRLLRDILDKFSDHARRHDVWFKDADSYVLYTTPPERLLPQEHFTRKPHEPREQQARLASLLLRVKRLE
jgi:hypothetical protein